MVPALRQQFNAAFSIEKYNAFLQDLHSKYPGAMQFRIAETPEFIDREFTRKLLDACETIVDVITDPGFLKMTDRSIPPAENVPNETAVSNMIAFDFGICINEKNELEPQLIEMQGFPTLYGFQVYYPDVLQRHFDIPSNYTQYLGGYTRDTYLADLKKVILGEYPPEEVILLEIKPHEQKTKIDFYCTEDYIGIQPVCITELIQEGRQLFYINAATKKKSRVSRIYNRIIFDDLNAQKAHLGEFVDITQDLNVQWAPHPNWFYRISKFTLPFIHHPFVPETRFLNEVPDIPADLDNYVLKPLFSFAGQGVVIDVTPADIAAVNDPENWILQRKVRYANVIETPGIPAKFEIRMMYLWKDGAPRPTPAINLTRLSKGKMIGVRYNKDMDWVGGSVALFEH